MEQGEGGGRLPALNTETVGKHTTLFKHNFKRCFGSVGGASALRATKPANERAAAAAARTGSADRLLISGLVNRRRLLGHS